MANRIGTLLTFKEGTTKAEAIAALRKIREVLDVPATVYDWEIKGQRPTTGKDMIKEYNDEHGGPVWYIP